MLTPSLSELPPFLTQDSGLNNGYMIAQYTAASLVSENKVLCHPASVDSIPTSGDQEDHVSMGMTSALKLQDVARNTQTVLAIEALCAAQAIDLLAPLKPGPARGRGTTSCAASPRSSSATATWRPEIEATAEAVASGRSPRWPRAAGRRRLNSAVGGGIERDGRRDTDPRHRPLLRGTASS